MFLCEKKIIVNELIVKGNLYFSHLKKFRMKKYSIVIHGGAGTLVKGLMTPEKEEQYKAALNEALEKRICCFGKWRKCNGSC